VLAAVHERYAAAVPVLYRARSDENIEALLANQVDLAILAEPRLDKRLRYQTLFQERVSLVSSRAHPFFGVPTIRAEQLETAALVSLSHQTPTGILVQKYLDRLGVHVEPVVSTEDIQTVKRLVEMGIGAAFLPDMVTHRDVASRSNPGARLYRSQIEPPLTRDIVLVTWDESPSSRAVGAFVEEVRRQSSTWPAAAKGNG
jgi:DNA-binding transcriptional LysR family regulator